MMIRNGSHPNPVERASSSHRYKYRVSAGNIIHLITGVVLGLVLSPFSHGYYRGFYTETSRYDPCYNYKINVNADKADLAATLKKSASPSKKRLLRAVYGHSIDEFSRIIHDLATSRPALQQTVLELESSMIDFAHHALHSIGSDINVDEAISSLDEPEPPTVVIETATYGPKMGTNITDRGVASRADVKWILDRLIFNSVLRIPKGVSLTPFFGTTPNGQINGQPYTLDIEGVTANAGTVKVSINAPDGILQSDLIISSAQPTQNIPINPDKLKDTLLLITKGKTGLDIGGPSNPIFQMDLYKSAMKTDVINFSEKTIWSTFKHGATFHYEGGGSGIAYITDGSTLKGISDSSYDFVIGSHYLEHLNNPLEALVAIKRVTKPGGHVILILPRKEACFDHLRGQSKIEDFIFRYLHKIQATDMRYANLESWVYGNDLKRDVPAGSFYQLLARSIRYPDNRSIHIMVYDFKLLEVLGKLLSFEIILKGVTKELHQWIVFSRK